MYRAGIAQALIQLCPDPCMRVLRPAISLHPDARIHVS